MIKDRLSSIKFNLETVDWLVPNIFRNPVSPTLRSPSTFLRAHVQMFNVKDTKKNFTLIKLVLFRICINFYVPILYALNQVKISKKQKENHREFYIFISENSSHRKIE